jgi:UDP-N-acetyl-D-glucosamine dehydrogenase
MSKSVTANRRKSTRTQDARSGSKARIANPALELAELIHTRKAKVAVIGLGYVGLPLARAFCKAGFPVTGFDIDPRKIESLRKGESYILQIDSDWIKEKSKEGKFHATDEFRNLRQMNAVIICVPTPLTKTFDPDMSFIEKTSREIRTYLDRGQLIVLESTTYPGTTEEVVKPILEESGLLCGKDFFLAFSPEREDPGNKKFHTTTIPKLVGGLDAVSGRLATDLYAAAIDKVIPLSHAKVAEAAKILENIYRCVNIALVNELKMCFDRMGIDVWEVIQAASTKPFGFHPFYPGPGLGGHCIPIDPFYLTWKAREYGFTTRFIELAGEINTSMPHYVVDKTIEALNARKKTVNGSKGLIIGVSYKPDVDDIRESPAFEVIELLQKRGARISYHDPFVPRIPKMRHHDIQLESVPLKPEVLKEFDFGVVITHHTGIDWDLLAKHLPLVVDSRNACAHVKENRDRIVKA